MQSIRWGIIGCGDVAEKKGGPALYQANGSELVAVMRRDRAKAEDFARRHHARRAYDDANDLLTDPEVDAVYIATPPHLHYEQTLAAARAGKHILCEKPMALTLAQCNTMIEVCSSAKVQLDIAYYRRFWPKWVATRQLLEAGELGTVLGARLHLTGRFGGGGWRVDPVVSGGGHFVDVGSHRLDMVQFLLEPEQGPVMEIAGHAQNLLEHHKAENDVTLSLQFQGGAVLSGAFHFASVPARDVLEIYGSRATLIADPFDSDMLRLVRTDGSEETLSFTTPTPTHLPLVQALVDSYRNNSGACISGAAGAATTRVLRTILRR